MNRFGGKKALPVSSFLAAGIVSMGLASGWNRHLLFSAWDKVSGAGNYALKKFYRDGTLYVTVSSSVVRSSLSFRKKEMLDAINALLATDPLFIRGCDVSFVKEIVLK